MPNSTPTPSKPFTFIDLFCGIGGFHLALSRLGGNCVFASDIDARGHDLYEKNFGMRPVGDIWAVPVEKIPKHDVLTGGFPCQSFSLAGNQQGFAEARGQLFFRICEIIKHHRPKVVFLENVRNLAAHDDGKTLARIEQELRALNYDFTHKVINAATHGAPTARKRIYIIAWPQECPLKGFTFPVPTGAKECVAQHLDAVYAARHAITTVKFSCNAASVAAIESKFTLDAEPLRLGNKVDGTPTQAGQGNRVYSIKGVAITFASGGGGLGGKTGLYWDRGVVRRLSPREAARIMGYPNTFHLHPQQGAAYHQIGNSVQVHMIEQIARQFVPLL